MDRQLIEQLGVEERSLWRRYGVRLRVDTLTGDGKNLLCCTRQLKRRFFTASLVDHELVTLAHKALMKLNLLGLRPMIAIVPKEATDVFTKIEATDPFRLLQAMDLAGSHTTSASGRTAQLAFGKMERRAMR